MTTRAVELPYLRSVVLAGHAGAGKTTLAEQLLFRSGAIPRLGRVDDGTASLDFEPEEQKRKESLGLAVASFEHDGHRVTLHRHARLPGLRRRGRLGVLRRGCRAVRDGRVGRRRGRPRDGGRPRAVQRPGGDVRHQQGRSRERRPDRGARQPAVDVRDEDRAAPAGDRGGRVLRGLRRSRPPQGLGLGRQDRGRDPDPGRPGRRGRSSARSAARGRRRGRRRRPDEVPRGRGDLRRRARDVSPPGRPRLDPRTGPRRVGDQGHRPAWPDRCAVPLLPGSVGGGAGQRDRQGRQRRRRAARRRRTARRPGLQDRGRPVCRQAHLSAGPVRDAAQPGQRIQRQSRRGGADRPAAAAPWQGAGADRRAPGRRDRGGRQAGGHPHRRHPVVEGSAPDARSDPVPDPDARPGDRAPDQGRPRQDGRGPGADARGGAVRAGRAIRGRRADPRSRPARPTSPSSPSGSSASSVPRS